MTASVRHETRALLRAHLSAASAYRHVTHRCPVCHRLLRLAMDSSAPDSPALLTVAAPPGEPTARQARAGERGASLT